MKTIAIASQKGGAGKTTLTAHLSCAAIAAGAGPVRIMDTDPQASLADQWASLRTIASPALVSAPIRELAARVASLQDEPGVLLIDTPPALSREIAMVIAAADFVLVPVQPSPTDLRAVGGTVDILTETGKPFAFVVNRTAKRSRWTAPAVAELSHHGPVCPVMIHDWIVLREGFLNGTSVVDTAPSSDAADEINRLWAYVSGRLAPAKAKRRKSA